MIPRLESIPESDFQKLMIPIPIQIPAKIDFFLYWDIYHGCDSDSDFRKKRNHDDTFSIHYSGSRWYNICVSYAKIFFNRGYRRLEGLLLRGTI